MPCNKINTRCRRRRRRRHQEVKGRIATVCGAGESNYRWQCANTCLAPLHLSRRPQPKGRRSSSPTCECRGRLLCAAPSLSQRHPRLFSAHSLILQLLSCITHPGVARRPLVDFVLRVWFHCEDLGMPEKPATFYWNIRCPYQQEEEGCAIPEAR